MIHEVKGEVSVYVIDNSYDDKILKTFEKVTINVKANSYDDAFRIASDNEINKHKEEAQHLFESNGYDGSNESIKRLIAFDDDEGNILIDYDMFKMKLFDV